MAATVSAPLLRLLPPPIWFPSACPNPPSRNPCAGPGNHARAAARLRVDNQQTSRPEFSSSLPASSARLRLPPLGTARDPEELPSSAAGRSFRFLSSRSQ